MTLIQNNKGSQNIMKRRNKNIRAKEQQGLLKSNRENSFGEFFSRSFDNFGKVNLHRLAHAQNRLQCGISDAFLDVCDHLWRKPGFLRHKVFGQFAPHPLLLEERNYFDAERLSFSTHPS
jgi:hypothetical protein